MESACEHKNFDELGNLAHWLKGAAGTVGFDVFTEPARRLEQSARQKNEVMTAKALITIRQLVSRICIPDASTDN